MTLSRVVPCVVSPSQYFLAGKYPHAVVTRMASDGTVTTVSNGADKWDAYVVALAKSGDGGVFVYKQTRQNVLGVHYIAPGGTSVGGMLNQATNAMSFLSRGVFSSSLWLPSDSAAALQQSPFDEATRFAPFEAGTVSGMFGMASWLLRGDASGVIPDYAFYWDHVVSRRRLRHAHTHDYAATTGAAGGDADGDADGAGSIADKSDVSTQGEGRRLARTSTFTASGSSFGTTGTIWVDVMDWGVEPGYFQADLRRWPVRAMSDINEDVLNNNGMNKHSNPRFLTPFGSGLCASAADNSTTGRELWCGDRSGWRRITDINTGSGDANPMQLISHAGALYFFASPDGGTTWHLYTYDGVTAPTVVAAADAAVAAFNATQRMASLGADLYFVATPTGGAADTIMSLGAGGAVAAATASSMAHGAQDLTAFNGQVYFTAPTASQGRELHVMNPAASGAVAFVQDLCPGACDSQFAGALAIGAKLFFAADAGNGWRDIHELAATGGATPVQVNPYPCYAPSLALELPYIARSDTGTPFFMAVPDSGVGTDAQTHALFTASSGTVSRVSRSKFNVGVDWSSGADAVATSQYGYRLSVDGSLAAVLHMPGCTVSVVDLSTGLDTLWYTDSTACGGVELYRGHVFVNRASFTMVAKVFSAPLTQVGALSSPSNVPTVVMRARNRLYGTGRPNTQTGGTIAMSYLDDADGTLPLAAATWKTVTFSPAVMPNGIQLLRPRGNSTALSVLTVKAEVPAEVNYFAALDMRATTPTTLEIASTIPITSLTHFLSYLGFSHTYEAWGGPAFPCGTIDSCRVVDAATFAVANRSLDLQTNPIDAVDIPVANDDPRLAVPYRQITDEIVTLKLVPQPGQCLPSWGVEFSNAPLSTDPFKTAVLAGGLLSVAAPRPPVGGASFTVEAWLLLDATPPVGSEATIVRWGSSSASVLALAATATGVTVSVQAADGSTTASLGTTSSPLAAGTWTHTACTYDASTGATSVLVNGTAVAQGWLPALHPDVDVLVMGGGFAGQLDDVRLWNVTMLPSQVAASALVHNVSLHPMYPSALLASFSMQAFAEDGDRTGAVKPIGSVYFLPGAAPDALLPLAVAGAPHAAMLLDGATHSVTATGAVDLVAGAGWAVDFLARPALLPAATNPVLSVGTDLHIAFVNGRLTVTWGGTALVSAADLLAQDPTTTDAVAPWQHLAVTFNASSGRVALWRHGVVVGEATVAGTAPAAAGAVVVGHDGTNWYTGALDEVRLWSDAYGADDRATVRRWTGGALSSPAVAAALLLYLDFNRATPGPSAALTNRATHAAALTSPTATGTLVTTVDAQYAMRSRHALGVPAISSLVYTLAPPGDVNARADTMNSTVEGWIRQTALGADDHIVTLLSYTYVVTDWQPVTVFDLVWQPANHTLRMYWAGAWYESDWMYLSFVGEWHHWVVRFDAANAVTVTVDGVNPFLQANVSVSPIATYTYQDVLFANSMDAELDELRVWSAFVETATVEAWKYQRVEASHPAYGSLQWRLAFDTVAGSVTPVQDLLKAEWQLVEDVQHNHHYCTDGALEVRSTVVTGGDMVAPTPGVSAAASVTVEFIARRAVVDFAYVALGVGNTQAGRPAGSGMTLGWTASNDLVADFGGGDVVSATVPANDTFIRLFHHYAVVYEAPGGGTTGSVQLFVDGQLVGSAATAPALSLVDQLYVGGLSGSMTGDVSEVRVWTSKLDAATLGLWKEPGVSLLTHPARSALSAHFTFDRGTVLGDMRVVNLAPTSTDGVVRLVEEGAMAFTAGESQAVCDAEAAYITEEVRIISCQDTYVLHMLVNEKVNGRCLPLRHGQPQPTPATVLAEGSIHQVDRVPFASAFITGTSGWGIDPTSEKFDMWCYAEDLAGNGVGDVALPLWMHEYCPVGHARTAFPNGTFDCTRCLAGTASCGSGPCEPCPANTFAALQSQGECKPCGCLDACETCPSTAGVCTLNAGTCAITNINGTRQCWNENATKPAATPTDIHSQCFQCLPGQSTALWSAVPNGTTCDDGDPCTTNDQCSTSAAGTFCTGTLFSTCLAERFTNDPNQDCEVCSTASPGTCELKSGYGKQSGQCGCSIAGSFATWDSANPSNQCEFCRTSAPGQWTAGAVGTACDDGQQCTRNDVCNVTFNAFWSRWENGCAGETYTCTPQACQNNPQCQGDGTCLFGYKTGVTCADKVDECDLAVNCENGNPTCPNRQPIPPIVTAGTVKMAWGEWNPAQYAWSSGTTSVWAHLDGFDVTCDSLMYEWGLMRVGGDPNECNAAKVNTSLGSGKWSAQAEFLKRVSSTGSVSASPTWDVSPTYSWRGAPGYELYTELTGLALEHLAQYKIVTRFFSGLAAYANSSQVACSAPFTIDATPPTQGYAIVTDPRAFGTANQDKPTTVVANSLRVVFGNFTEAESVVDGTLPIFYCIHANLVDRMCLLTNYVGVQLTPAQVLAGEFTTNATEVVITQGQTMYVQMWAQNAAGAFSMVLSPRIVSDLTPPTLPCGVSDATPGLPFTADVDFLPSAALSALRAVWPCGVQDESDIAMLEVAVGTTSGGTNMLDWTALADPNATEWVGDFSATPLDGAATYHISLRATNAGGLTSTFTSDGVSADATPAVASAVKEVLSANSSDSAALNNVDVDWVPPGDVVLRGGCADPESGIVAAAYKLDIARASGSTAGPNTTGWMDIPVVPATVGNLLFNTTHRFAVGDSVVAHVRCTNGAYQATVATSDGVAFDDTPPDVSGASVKLVGTQAGMTISWPGVVEDAPTSVIMYRWALSVDGAVQNWNDVGTITSVVEPLAHVAIPNASVAVVVEVTNSAGMQVNLTMPPRVFNDATPPVPGTATDVTTSPTGNDNITSSTTTVSVSWQGFTDPESPPDHYEVAVSECALLNFAVQPFVAVPGNTTATLSNLTLTPGVRYCTTVRYISVALLAADTTTDGFVVDSTPPSPGTVVHLTQAGWAAGKAPPRFAAPAAASPTPIAWSSWSDVDGTAIVRYTVCLTGTPATLACDVAAAVQLGADAREHLFQPTDMLRNLTGGDRLVAVVVGLTDANLATTAASVGVVVDATAPTVAATGALRIGRHPTVSAGYQLSSQTLTVRWSGFQEDATDANGVRETLTYHVAVGTSPSGTDLVPALDVGVATFVELSGFHAAVGTQVWAHVVATNEVGLSVSSASLPVTILPPHLVHPGAVSLPTTTNLPNATVAAATQFVSDATAITAVWTSFLNASYTNTSAQAAVEYRWAVGVAPYGAGVSPWSSVATSLNATATGLALREGGTYYVSVVAHAMAEATPAVAVSAPVVLDTTPPLPGTVVDAAANAADAATVVDPTALHCSWLPFTDAVAGIAAYDVAVVRAAAPSAAVVFAAMRVGADVRTYTFTPPVSGAGSTLLAQLAANQTTVFCSVTGIDAASRATTAFSNGVALTSSSNVPTPGTVRDGPHAGVDVDVVAHDKVFHATWDAFTDAGGMRSYAASFWLNGTPPTQLGTTQDVGLVRRATFSGFAVDTGSTCYVQVVGTNSVSNTATARSDGFLVQIVSPEVSLMVGDVVVRQAVGVDTRTTCMCTDPRAVFDLITASCLCSPATYLSLTQGCTSCPPSSCKRVTSNRQVDCVTCPDDRNDTAVVTQPAMVATATEACPGDNTRVRYVASPSSPCVCPPGHFHDAASGACTLCPANTYKPDAGDALADCAACPTNAVAVLSVPSATLPTPSGPAATANLYVDAALGGAASMPLPVVSRSVSGGVLWMPVPVPPRQMQPVAATWVVANNAGAQASTLYMPGVDLSPPIAGTVVDGPSPAVDLDFLNHTDTVTVQWSGFHEHDASADVNFAPQATASLCVDLHDASNLTAVVASQPLCWPLAAAPTSATFTGLALANNATYFASIVAVNDRGLRSTARSDGFRVDTTTPTCTAAVGAAYLATPTWAAGAAASATVVASWQCNAGIAPLATASYDIVLVSAATGSETVVSSGTMGATATASAAVVSHTFTAADWPAPVAGDTAFLRVTGANAAGSASATATSTSVLFDATPPTLVVLGMRTGGNATTNVGTVGTVGTVNGTSSNATGTTAVAAAGTTLSVDAAGQVAIVAAASDAETGVAGLTAVVQTADAATAAVVWRSSAAVAPGEAILVPVAVLEANTWYRAVVEATNGAGMTTHSNVTFAVDKTSPVAQTVIAALPYQGAGSVVGGVVYQSAAAGLLVSTTAMYEDDATSKVSYKLGAVGAGACSAGSAPPAAGATVLVPHVAATVAADAATATATATASNAAASSTAAADAGAARFFAAAFPASSPLPNGTAMCVTLQATNSVGRTAAFSATATVVVDTTPPACDVTWSVAAGEAYVVAWSCTDGESPVTEPLAAVTLLGADGSHLADLTASASATGSVDIAALGTTLTRGTAYAISVTATNAALLTSVAQLSFVAEATAPAFAAVAPTLVQAAGPTLRCSAALGGCFCSADAAVFLPTTCACACGAGTLWNATVGACVTCPTVFDCSTAVGDAATAASPAPQGNCSDVGLPVALPLQPLRIGWVGTSDAETAVTFIGVTTGAEPRGGAYGAAALQRPDLASPTPVTALVPAPKTPMAPGVVYATVVASDRGGHTTSITGPVAVVDATPPTAPCSVIDLPASWDIATSTQVVDIAWTSSQTVWATWCAFVDPESGMPPHQEFTWGVGTSPGTMDVTGPIAASTTIGTKDNVPLVAGTQYFVTVMTANAGGVVGSASSNGFIYDATPPVASGPVRFGATQGVNRACFPLAMPGVHLGANWEPFEDLESGLAFHEVQITRQASPVDAPTAVTPWIRVPANTTSFTATAADIISPPVVGDMLSLTVRAFNAAGIHAHVATAATNVHSTTFAFVTCAANAIVDTCTDDATGAIVCLASTA